MPEAQLQRRINLPLLTFYGVGTILGAGIYVLIGQVAGYAGYYTPVAFLVASLLAGFTAFSYAELATRFPRSAGEAIYVQEGFGRAGLSRAVGLLIVAVGCVSSATLSRGLLGYLAHFVSLPPSLVILLCVLILTGVVIWGIAESVWLASLMTLVEMGGLLLIIWVARPGFAQLPQQWPQLVPGLDGALWSGVLLGAFVAFYAFIGFEDMVNVAEEVLRPHKTLPRGIILALFIATGFYFLVSLLSVLVVVPADLAQQRAPLAYIYTHMTGRSPDLIAFIGVASIINGILVQIVMASRILYGMSRRGWIPGWLGKVQSRTHTPVFATLVVAGLILGFALLLPLLSLAKLTSFISLSIFILINLALWRIKRRGLSSPGLSVPLWVPVCGFLFSLVFVIYQLLEWI